MHFYIYIYIGHLLNNCTYRKPTLRSEEPPTRLWRTRLSRACGGRTVTMNWPRPQRTYKTKTKPWKQNNRYHTSQSNLIIVMGWPHIIRDEFQRHDVNRRSGMCQRSEGGRVILEFKYVQTFPTACNCCEMWSTCEKKLTTFRYGHQKT